MRSLCLLLIAFYFCLPADAQQASPNTYAVIVGISKYGSEGITSLDFAHRDAEEFAKFLRSKAGGSVPEENTRLLLNEEATYSAIYDGLYWLLEVSKKNDLIYFYFSGHGDVENNTIYKLGFLLAANTPRFNYVNNAIRIEDVNNVANTLSVNKGARVVIITDACHSGNLAGNANRGNFLVGQQLRTVKGNEIRISSCGPDELSNEDEGWGGGRGVFSYYLVKGMEGLADSSNDKIVTLNEIKTYLSSAIASDKLMSGKPDKQTPIVTGPGNIELAKVDPVSFVALQQQSADISEAPMAKLGLSALGVSPQGYFFSLLKESSFEDNSIFESLAKLKASSIPFSFINSIISSNKESKIDSAKIDKLIASLHENPDALKRFNEKFVEVLADKGQKVINLYLEGDEAELEKRKYYSAYSKGYDVFVNMFATAIKLVSPQNPMHRILEVKLHYFSGIVARLKIPISENYKALIDEAMKEQLAALQLEENAAYIHNELGMLYKLKKNKAKAEEHFIRATEISPTWALPWSNLSGLYINDGDFVKGNKAVEKSIELQPGYQGALLNKGLLNQKKGNLLLAEEYYQKSIKINSRHYLPFERLGYVYMHTTRYRQADSNFLEADKRKRGFKFIPAQPDQDGDGVVDQFDQEPMPCFFDTTKVKQNDIIGNFYIGLLYVKSQQYDKAEYKFKQVIKIDPRNPLAFHYLGKILFQQEGWEEADIVFNYALKYYLDKEQFDSYCDSLGKIFPGYILPSVTLDANSGKQETEDNRCAFNYFKESWFQKPESQFFLGTVYEKWNHFLEAEKQFRDIISDNPWEIGAYYKLWNVFEHTGRYYDAEETIKSFPDTTRVEKDLTAFYRRVTARYPENGEWQYKAGTFIYNKYLAKPAAFTGVRSLKSSSEMPAVPITIPGTNEVYILSEDILILPDGINYFEKASSLFSEPEIVSEINFKLGDLYLWQGLPEQAEQAYKRSIELNPDDANTRIKYINTSSMNYNLGAAIDQLDSLYQRNEINLTNRLLMAKYCIYAGRFEDAGKLLRKAITVHPYVINEITNLNGLLHLSSSDPSLAIPFYKELLAAEPDNYETMYTLATLYRKTNNNTEAWKYLAMALKKGFNYYWVLKYDESWDRYRNSGKWRSLTSHVLPGN